MAPRLHLVRHGKGYHQEEPTEKNQYLPDPLLTDEGIERCKSFAKNFPKSIQLDLICSSPLRRTVQTAKYSFTDYLERLSPIILLPYAQEATELPSDTGSDRAIIEKEFGDLVDATLVEDGWNSNKGVYAATPEALIERARRLREWLQARPESEVVVVGHGNFWHYLTGDVDAEGNQTTPYWSNNEWRSYRFVASEDGSAKLEEENESIQRRELPN